MSSSPMSVLPLAQLTCWAWLWASKLQNVWLCSWLESSARPDNPSAAVTATPDKLDGCLRPQRGRCRCSDLGGFDCADHDEFLGAFPRCDESACLEQDGPGPHHRTEGHRGPGGHGDSETVTGQLLHRFLAA
jgi:hypothetical protein